MKEKGTVNKIIKIAAAVTAGLCIFALLSFGIADAVAYSYKRVEEEQWDYTFYFTEGKRDEPGTDTVEIVEKFDESKARDVLPGTNFMKVIDLKSNASYESYGYVLLEIGTVEAMKAADMIPRVYDSAEPQINAGCWELIYQDPSGETGKDSKYIYRYKTALKPGESTAAENNRTSLCEYFRIPEFTEVNGDERNIGVKGYLIQTVGFETGTLASPGTADMEAIRKLTE